jgi:hypothetical protein
MLGRLPPMLGRLIVLLMPEPGKLILGRLIVLLLPEPGKLILGRVPPIVGRLILPGNVVGRLFPPMLGRFTVPGSVVGRFTLPSDGRSPPPGNDGRFCPMPVPGSVVGREIFVKFPEPPNEGREPPIDGNPPAFPPMFGIDGRVIAFPNEGRDMLGTLGREMLAFGRDMFDMFDMFDILGRDILGVLGRDMLDILGLAPPPPMLPIDGLAPPPPPSDGRAPPPPPRPRCADAMGVQATTSAKATAADIN